MSITLPKSCWFPRNFVAILLFFAIFINSVQCVRSSSSSAESNGATGPSSSSMAASSLVPTSTSHHHRGDRELISAQFRAVQDARDLDTSESSVSVTGLESLSAAAAAAAGLEDDPLVLSKYMAASASAYPPSKIARLNRYPQTGFYDPYPSYAPAALNAVPSSYYPYNAYSSYRDTNPMLDTYPYYERDRIRELRERAMQAAQSAPYSSSSSSSSSGSSNRDGYSGGSSFLNSVREGFRSSDHDNLAMSSAHGHEEGHGHGWGWGMYTSKVNTNAIGLLGLLGLLSLLSNVLMQFTTTTTTTTTAAMMGGRRRKRSITGEAQDNIFESREEKRERIFMEILPHLTPVAHARDGVIPLECTFNGVCMANRVLVDEFGIHGRAGGMRISSAIVKLLDKVPNQNVSDSKLSYKKPYDKARKYPYTGKKPSSLDFRKMLESAGLDGRNKKDCQKSYPVCNALRKQVMPNFPFSIRMQDLPQLITKANQMAQQRDPHAGKVPMKL